jgi:NAD(P)-dependent dehydrogenase (short-subunit alcohol dehydrogenase family)
VAPVASSWRVTRTALVTGGNRGIGHEACRRLAEAGLDVVLTSRDPEAGRSAAEELGVRWAQLDVSDPASVAACARGQPALDVLVNNAGVLLDEGRSALGLDEETLRATFEVNFFGAFRTCRTWLPGMVERGYGRVVNVSSGAGSISQMTTYAPAYSMSKAALNALSRMLAFAAHVDVKVNAMSPGWVRTDMGGPAAPRGVEEGVDTLVWLATLPADGPSGGFFADRRQLAW